MSNFNPGKPVLQKTEDGSHTLFLEHLDETYHSSSGALTESIHVFINYGFACVVPQETIKVLEVGFGTGMNAILTYIESEKNKQKVNYQTLEPFPIPLELVEKIDMGFVSQSPTYASVLQQMHSQSANQKITLGNAFDFTRIDKTIQEFEGKKESIDVIYFDAFAPRKQPEMWEYEVLERCVSLLKKGGIFITYCANGQFKRNLKSLGIILSNPPGIKGRREITQGMKP